MEALANITRFQSYGQVAFYREILRRATRRGCLSRAATAACSSNRYNDARRFSTSLVVAAEEGETRFPERMVPKRITPVLVSITTNKILLSIRYPVGASTKLTICPILVTEDYFLKCVA